jgi:hypothetical protein
VPDRHHLRNLAKKKFENLGKFSDAKNRPSTHHDLPATHHNFTTKTPHKNSFFSRKPLEKRPSHHAKKIRPGNRRTASLKSNRLT